MFRPRPPALVRALKPRCAAGPQPRPPESEADVPHPVTGRRAGWSGRTWTARLVVPLDRRFPAVAAAGGGESAPMWATYEGVRRVVDEAIAGTPKASRASAATSGGGAPLPPQRHHPVLLGLVRAQERLDLGVTVGADTESAAGERH